MNKSNKSFFTISDMAKRTGLTPSAIRFYDKEGLLPLISRSDSGRRQFTQTDFEFIKIIECLKSTGMSLKDIKNYIQLISLGDASIDARLDIFYRQKEILEQQIAQIKEMLDIAQFKCWFYETGKAAGTLDVPRNMALKDIPEPYRTTKEKYFMESEN